MLSNKWSAIKRRNNGKALALDVGMAQEAEKEGALLKDRLGASAVGHRLPEALYWLILLIGIIMYLSGRILFFRHMKQMAEEYGWDLDSLV